MCFYLNRFRFHFSPWLFDADLLFLRTFFFSPFKIMSWLWTATSYPTGRQAQAGSLEASTVRSRHSLKNDTSSSCSSWARCKQICLFFIFVFFRNFAIVYLLFSWMNFENHKKRHKEIFSETRKWLWNKYVHQNKIFCPTTRLWPVDKLILVVFFQ